MQYTLRNIPKELDRALRQRARREGKTLNEVAVHALAEGLGMEGAPRVYRSVRDLLGTRSPDPELQAALQDQRRVDPDLSEVRIALDTNRYDDLLNGDASVADLIEGAEAVYLPFVVVAELRAGFAFGARRADNERLLRRFLAKPGIDVIFASEQTTYHYASVYAQLRKQGTPIPTNDLWIAALVLEHDLVLCSRDAHFDHVAQLLRV